MIIFYLVGVIISAIILHYVELVARKRGGHFHNSKELWGWRLACVPTALMSWVFLVFVVIYIIAKEK